MKNPFINLGVIALTIFTTHSSILQAAQKDTTFVATQNPVVSYKYLGDPAALVHDGTVYIYAGHDECPAPQQYYLMNEWCIFSTKDMKTFTEHAYTLKATDLKWAKGEAWASQVIERNGKFYWYVTVEHATIPGKSIGVAVSDSPIGPFKDARGSALITNDMTTQYTSIAWDDIDPTVFIDDDGQAYLFWGNTQCYYAKLKDNRTGRPHSSHQPSQIHRSTLGSQTWRLVLPVFCFRIPRKNMLCHEQEHQWALDL